MLEKKVLESIQESVLCWLATVNSLGEPNVSPKEMFVAYKEEAILIANIASPVSINNIKVNPKVCLSFIEIFKQKGFKIQGTASIIEQQDETYDKKVALLRHLGGEGFPIKEIIQIQVNSVTPLIAPSYWLYPDKTTESSQVEQSLNTYGVRR